MKNKYSAFLLVCLLFILILFSGCIKELTNPYIEKEEPPNTGGIGSGVGQTAPDFTLNDLNDISHTLYSYRAATNAVLIDFWATWCGPCVDNMPLTQSHHAAYSAQGLKVLAIDIQESKAAVQAFITANGYTFTTLLDSTGSIANKYNIAYIPRNILIDKDGIVRFYGHPLDLTTALIEQYLP